MAPVMVMSDHSPNPERSITEPVWNPVNPLSSSTVPADVLSWLVEPGSLTHRLQLACKGNIHVEIVSHCRQRPMLNEAFALGMRHDEHALVRQVRLKCQQQTWVFARSVIPFKTLTGRCRRLAHLGEKPLGAMLFADSSMHRDPVEIAMITPRQPLFMAAVQNLKHKPKTIWGRRSVFYLDSKPLLVSEMFMPEVAKIKG